MAEDKTDSVAAKPPKIKAEDNPWYLLATLYGERKQQSDFDGQNLHAKNRNAWNRYYAATIDPQERERLCRENRFFDADLIPFSPEELQGVREAFSERCKAAEIDIEIPHPASPFIFSDVQFDGEAFFGGFYLAYASFDGAIFANAARFDGAYLKDAAWFRGATFSGAAVFEGATFSGGARFDRATFSRWASFAGATFSGAAVFEGSTFSGGAGFDGATYSGEASFAGATFSGCAFFSGAAFSGAAFIDGATFSGPADFDKATFGGITIFVNAEMKSVTSFSEAIFNREPPRFFGAKLHQGTVWRGIEWPKKPKGKEEAGSFIDAYACLKLEMDRLKKHEDELDFFALELQSRRVLLGALSLESWVIATYGLLSNYGRNYFKPFVALIVVAVIGAVVFWYFDAHTIGEALFLSAANTLNVFGFRRDFFEASCIEGQPAVLKFVAAAQTIIGTILLFLFGLGIRNKFRMK